VVLGIVMELITAMSVIAGMVSWLWGCGRWSDISGHGYVCRMVIVVDVGVVEMLWN